MPRKTVRVKRGTPEPIRSMAKKTPSPKTVVEPVQKGGKLAKEISEDIREVAKRFGF